MARGQEASMEATSSICNPLFSECSLASIYNSTCAQSAHGNQKMGWTYRRRHIDMGPCANVSPKQFKKTVFVTGACQIKSYSKATFDVLRLIHLFTRRQKCCVPVAFPTSCRLQLSGLGSGLGDILPASLWRVPGNV